MFETVQGPPGAANWTVAFGEVEDEDAGGDAAAENGDVIVIALSPGQEHDIPGVSEVEHRFSLVEDSIGDLHVVYVGVALHRHGTPGDCERFAADAGEADVDDVPDGLRRILSEGLEFDVHAAGEGPLDGEPVNAEEIVEDSPFDGGGGI